MQNLQHFELDLKLCEDTFCPLCHIGVKVEAPKTDTYSGSADLEGSYKIK